jgi:hypothetical protein
MARGKHCPQCDFYMHAKDQIDYPAGTEVLYECSNPNCRFQEKVFEDSRRPW